MIMSQIAKGNIVTGAATGKDALVLALTKDGKRAKLHIYGWSDCGTGGKINGEVWLDVDRFTVTTSGEAECWKCGGSGLYYSGGAVVNGTYTGNTGPCFGCQQSARPTDLPIVAFRRNRAAEDA